MSAQVTPVLFPLSRPEQCTLIGHVVRPIGPDSFFVRVSDGPYKGEDFHVPKLGREPTLRGEVEITIIVESRETINWDPYPND